MPDLVVFVKGSNAKRGKVRFTRQRLVIGRASDCDLSLGHGTLSRQHLLIEEREGQWFVEDMGSSNGTRLNGEKIEGSCALSDGDVIAAGRVRMVVSGLGGRKSSIFRNHRPVASSVLIAAELGLGNLLYASQDILTLDALAAVDDEDIWEGDSLDLEANDPDAEIELNTMIRSVLDDGDAILPADSQKLEAWDALFGD